MLKACLQDLRGIIGLFFGILSVILLIASCFTGSNAAVPSEINLNLISGLIMGAFSALMITLAIRGKS